MIRHGIKRTLIKFLLKFALLFNLDRAFYQSEVRKVLVYAYTGLGNFILYTPTLRVLKKGFPNANFTLLHSGDTGCQEVVTGSSLFDDYTVVKRDAKWYTRLKWIYKLRKEKYDLIISEFHNNHPFLILLTVLCGAPYRAGHITSPGWNNNWDFIYNIPVKMKKDQHERDRYLELARALGTSSEEDDKKPFIFIEEDDIEFATNFLVNHNCNEKHKIISVQVGTSPAMRWKQWNLKKYGMLCDKILKLKNTKIILHGSPAERKMIDKVAEDISDSNAIIAAGEVSIKQAAAIIEKSDMLICNDSGLMHVAVAVDTPVIAIFGPTDYTRTAPLGEIHKMIRKDLECSPCFKLDGKEKVENCPYDYKCLNSIGVDEVFKVVLEKLKGGEQIVFRQ